MAVRLMVECVYEWILPFPFLYSFVILILLYSITPIVLVGCHACKSSRKSMRYINSLLISVFVGRLCLSFKSQTVVLFIGSIPALLPTVLNANPEPYSFMHSCMFHLLTSLILLLIHAMLFYCDVGFVGTWDFVLYHCFQVLFYE